MFREGGSRGTVGSRLQDRAKRAANIGRDEAAICFFIAGSSRRAPATEDQAAEGEAEPERPEGKGADRDALAPHREALSAAERGGLLLGELLASALLTHGAARLEPEIEVVEDLGTLFRHASSV